MDPRVVPNLIQVPGRCSRLIRVLFQEKTKIKKIKKQELYCKMQYNFIFVYAIKCYPQFARYRHKNLQLDNFFKLKDYK